MQKEKRPKGLVPGNSKIWILDRRGAFETDRKGAGIDTGEFFKCIVSHTGRRVLEERAVNCVEHFWRIKFNEDKKDIIDFGNVEVFSDLGKRFWSGGKARLPMTEVKER